MSDYWQCLKCWSVFNHEDDRCTECGSDKTQDIGDPKNHIKIQSIEISERKKQNDDLHGVVNILRDEKDIDQNEISELKKQAETAESKLNTANDIIEAKRESLNDARVYMRHKKGCYESRLKAKWEPDKYKWVCTCGLDKLIKHLSE